jgi:hypothetical protein
MTDIQKLCSEFETAIVAAVRRQLIAEVTVKMGGFAGLVGLVPNPVPPKKHRRKGPIQLCPVRNCSRRAAPVFGMVCAKHKDLPKATIRKYREQRRARKAK